MIVSGISNNKQPTHETERLMNANYAILRNFDAKKKTSYKGGILQIVQWNITRAGLATPS